MSSTSRPGRSPIPTASASNVSASAATPTAPAISYGTTRASLTSASSTSHTGRLRRLGMGHGEGQAGLAGPARPGQRHDAVVGERLVDPLELLLPADQPGRRGGQPRPRRRLRRDRAGRWAPVDLGRLLEHGPVELLQLAAGIDAELLDEQSARGVELAQCLGLPARPIQGERELSPQPLAERMLGDQLADRRDGELVLAERQPGVDLVLERGGPQLLEPGGLGDRGRSIRQVLEWLAAPEAERGPQFVQGNLGVDRPRRRQPRRRRADEELEAVGVERRPGSTSSRYPAPTVRSAGRPAPDPSPTVRRRYDTCTCRALTASASTCSPQTSSTRASADATFPSRNSSAVNRERGRPWRRASRRPSSRTSRGPRMANSTAVRVTTGNRSLSAI